MKQFTDRKWRISPIYSIGQSVWLDLRNIATGHPTRKPNTH
jgi:hypothetical protein